MRSRSYLLKQWSEAHVQSIPQEPRCTARGLGPGFTPACIHSQLDSYTHQIAQELEGQGEGRGYGEKPCNCVSGPWEVAMPCIPCRHLTPQRPPHVPCPMSHAQLWEQGLLEVPAPTPWGQGAVCGNRPMCLCTVSHCRDISTLGVEGRTTQNKICISLQGVSARGWAPSPAVTSRKQHPAAS